MADFTNNSSFNKNANFSGVKFGADAPLLETELNELQQIQEEARADIVRDSIPSGFIQLGDLDYTAMSITPNTIKLINIDSVAYVNGYKVVIPKNTIITLNTPPVDVPREDLVFLEVWKEEIDKTETITTGGKDGGTAITNYLQDSRIGAETSRRVQLRWRIRVVDGANFTTYPEGIAKNDGNYDYNCIVTPQGANTSPLAQQNSQNTTFWLNNQTAITNGYGLPNVDLGLYVGGTGSPTAKTVLGTVDGRVYAIPMFRVYRRPSCGYMESNEYLKVSPLCSVNLINGQTSQSKVAHTGLTGGVSTKIEGKTLVNQSIWTDDLLLLKYPSYVDTYYKLYGTYSRKFNFSGANDTLIHDFIGDATHKYFISAYMYISSYTSGSLGIQISDYGLWSNATKSYFNAGKLNQWQRVSTVVSGKSSFRCAIGGLTTSTSVSYLDGIMLYDLTTIYGAGNEPSDITTLERQLPYVSGAVSVKPVAIKTIGKNLFNVNAYTLRGVDSYVQYTVTGTNSIKIKSLSSDVWVSGFFEKIEFTPGTTYTFSCKYNILSGTQNPRFSIRQGLNPVLAMQDSSGSNGVISVSFTPTHKNHRIELFTSCGTANVGGEVEFYDIMLVEGSTPASDVVPYMESIVNLPTDISELKNVGSVKDTIDLQTGDYTKAISDWINLDGSLTWITRPTHPVDGIRVSCSSVVGARNNSTDLTVIKDNGIALGLDLSNTILDTCNFHSTDSYVQIMTRNVDTGWGGAYTPTASEIKAYFNGWKMYNEDGTSPYLSSLVPYTPSTWAEWTLTGTGSTKDSNGVHLVQDSSNERISMNTNFKPSTKYGVLYNVTACTLDSLFCYSVVGSDGVLPNATEFPKVVGNNKFVFTSNSNIVTNVWGMVANQTNTGNTYIDFKDVRIFELPSGSQIETDFNTLTADQLCAKYTFNGLCNKHWRRTVDGTGDTTTLPTTSYVGYTPYKMIYQLATPVVTNIKDKIEGRNYYNVGFNGINVDQVSSIEKMPVQMYDPLAGIGGCEVDSNSDGVVDGWVTANTQTPSVATSDVNGNCQKVFPNASVTEFGLAKDVTAGSTGDKVYMSFIGRTNNLSNIVSQKIQRYATGGYTNGEALLTQPLVANDTWYKASTICTWDSTKTRMLFGCRATTASTTDYALIDNIIVVNLTSLFGAGNEPPKDWCDKYLEYGTLTYIKAPVNSTALRVTNDLGAKLDSVWGNTAVIPPSKYKSGTYKLYYKNPNDQFTFPDVTITCGSQSEVINNSFSVGSVTLADSDVPYKKHCDGADYYWSLSQSISFSPYLPYGSTTQITFASADYNKLNVGDILYNPNATTSQIYIVSKDGSNKITVLNISPSFVSMQSMSMSWRVTSKRIDGLYTDIVDQRDIREDLRHLVSLNGFNYNNLLEESFDKLTRGEL